MVGGGARAPPHDEENTLKNSPPVDDGEAYIPDTPHGEM